MHKIRLLLIEDNPLLRDGIAAMLKGQNDIRVVASGGNGEKTILKIHLVKPQVILLDLGLRSQNSLRVVELVKKEFPGAKVIVMDLAPAQADILEYVKAGAHGFILKDATLDEFIATIRAVAVGEKVLPPLLAESLFSQIVGHALKGGEANLRDAFKMTKREREIIGLISHGLSNTEIGRRLRISRFTVKSHIHNIMEKLALHTRLEVANYMYSEGALKKEVAKTISIMAH